MEMTGSTVTAQQNATLTMMYLHTVRMVFTKLMEDRGGKGVLSLDFMTKMAATSSEEQMEQFVKTVSKNLLLNSLFLKISIVQIKLTHRTPSLVIAVVITRVGIGFGPDNVSHKFVIDIVVIHVKQRYGE